MKRKLILLLGSFIILLLAFGTYNLFMPGSVAMFDPSAHSRRRLSKNFSPGDGPKMGVNRGLKFYDRDSKGRLRGVYEVVSWTKMDDGSFNLVKPEAVVYHSNGQRTYMSAESGQIWAEEVAKGFNVSQGRLDGKVKIYFDQSRAMKRKHPRDRTYDQRANDVIEITVEDIRFDRDLLELHSESRVTLWSRTVDIVGDGLTILWNEKPRELRLLKIRKGDIMIVKEMPEQVDMIQLPKPTQPGEPVVLAGKGKPAGKTSVSSKAVKQKKASPAAPKPKAAVESKPKPKLAEKSAPEKEKSLDDQWDLEKKPAVETPTAATKVAELPAKSPVGGEDDETVVGPDTLDNSAALAAAEDPKIRNVYKATFSKSVRIHSGQRKLLGARELALQFEWDRAWRQEEKKKEKEKAKAKSAAISAGTPAKTDEAVEAAKDAPADVVKDAPAEADAVGLAKSADKDKDKKPAAPNTSGRMEIYWDGPLTIRPAGHVPAPSRKRYKITGHGDRVILSDNEARIICKSFEFQNPQQKAVFRGDEKMPTELQLLRGERISCRDEMQFDRSTGSALLDGPGMLRRYTRDDEKTAVTFEDLDEKLVSAGSVTEQIVWGEKVTAAFDDRKIKTSDGKTVTRPFIKSATFHKAVELRQLVRNVAEADVKKAPAGDYVKCEWLKVLVDSDKAGKAHLTSAHAKGSVYARLQDNEVRAADAFVKFRPVASKPGTAAKAKKKDKSSMLGMAGGRAEPIAIKASGKVWVSYKDPKKLKDPPVRIEAETVDVDMTRNVLGVLTGKPAKIWQGKDHIEGKVINFDVNAEAASVTGKGKLEFETKQDLSGNKLKKARPLKITWSRSMLYHGQSGRGFFDGDVDFHSADELLQCNQMRMFFAKSPAAAAKSKKPAGKSRRFMGLGIEQFSKNKFTLIEAEGGKGKSKLVLGRSQAQHPVNPVWLQRRVEIRGKKVLYYIQTGNAMVIGAGTLLAEDYRKPDKTRKPARGRVRPGMSWQLESPSQTLLAWKKSAFLNQEERHVKLQGKATMIHRSGKEVLLMKGLKTEPWGRLTSGQKYTLRCGEADIWFDEPAAKSDKKTAARDLMDIGPQLGTMKMFSAVRSVSFSNGPYSVDGQRVLYEGTKQLLTVWGYLPKAKNRTNARVNYEDARSGRVQSWESPTIVWDMKRDRIRVEKLEGGGGI
ncbi:MAG: hypothetical protein K8S55_05365 [Phycisphaerae bacterium]|nr:hypothetical protein [Phycisphaerae bacterium]